MCSSLRLESKFLACVQYCPCIAETNHCQTDEAALMVLVFISGSEVHRKQSTSPAHVGWAEENQDGGSQRAARFHHPHPRPCESLPLIYLFVCLGLFT